MKKLVVMALAGLMAAALPVSGSTAGGKSQTVDGEVALPARHPQETNSCYAGLQRRAHVLSQENFHNGALGYTFDIDKKSWKKPFKLEVTGGQGAVDLDLTFYTDFGTQDQAADPYHAPVNYSYETRGPGGEKGKVPKGMNVALVCMFDGAMSTFTYTAKLGK